MAEVDGVRFQAAFGHQNNVQGRAHIRNGQGVHHTAFVDALALWEETVRAQHSCDDESHAPNPQSCYIAGARAQEEPFPSFPSEGATMQRYSWLLRSWHTAYDHAQATHGPVPVKKTKALALVFVERASASAAAADTPRRHGQYGQPLRGQYEQPLREQRGQLRRGQPRRGQPLPRGQHGRPLPEQRGQPLLPGQRGQPLPGQREQSPPEQGGQLLLPWQSGRPLREQHEQLQRERPLPRGQYERPLREQGVQLLGGQPLRGQREQLRHGAFSHPAISLLAGSVLSVVLYNPHFPRESCFHPTTSTGAGTESSARSQRTEICILEAAAKAAEQSPSFVPSQFPGEYHRPAKSAL
jgi:hypothetical protein